MSSLEAKIVVLGSQGVGKTSLLMRYCKGAFNPAQTTSTIGASFMTKRVVDSDTDTVVRLQIWDTAGQERFRSISRLYYRGANACILCYSITDAQSFAEMGIWLTELRRNLPPDIVLHVVGTKADIVARDPTRREVPFERCIAYVAENLAPGVGSTPPPSATPTGLTGLHMPTLPSSSSAAAAAAISGSASSTSQPSPGGGMMMMMNLNSAAMMTTATTPTPSSNNPPQHAAAEPRSPSSKRSSGFWGQEVGWDACHEISAESGEGVEEVFRVVTRKLVEQNRKIQQAILAATATSTTPGATPGYYDAAGLDSGGGGVPVGPGGYFDNINPRGSFRVGRDRRSWFMSPSISVENAGGSGIAGEGGGGAEGPEGLQGHGERGKKRGRCC
ncbi:rab type ras GTPase [Camillea tinctor]|nr:rab type ras GTPase [Camillea tinctor]